MMISTLWLLLSCRAPSAAVPAEAPPPAMRDPGPAVDVHLERLRGICDGSAAAVLPDGALLLAYDEDTALHRFTGEGVPTGTGALHRLLGTSEQPEYDLEGAATLGDRIWWIGSHGTNGDGDPAPARQVFFATNRPTKPDLSDLAVVAGPVNLAPVLLADPVVAARLSPIVLERGAKAGGLNIEALAAHPGGGLVIGFRSPLSAADGLSGTALLVHLSPAGESWAVAGSHEVELGDRGFRDLAPLGDGWVAIAGGVDHGDFALVRVKPDFTTEPWGEPDWVKGLRPEALVRTEHGWLLLSDDGKIGRPDPTAKDGERGCDKIRREHGPGHPEVYLRARVIPASD